MVGWAVRAVRVIVGRVRLVGVGVARAKMWDEWDRWDEWDWELHG